MKKPISIIQLRPETVIADDEFAAIIRVGEIDPTEVIRIRAEQTLLEGFDASDYRAIIVGGSPFDITTPEAQRSEAQKALQPRINQMLDYVVTHDVPFFGACSGNGLLGNYCKTTISTKYGEPVSAVDITITEAGKSDPLLAGLPSPFRALVGHKEACDTTPNQAVLLASSSTCPVQMFRIKNNIYATQFHPEADGQIFAKRIAAYKHNGYFEPHEADAITKQVINENTPNAKIILKRFVKLIAK